MKILTVCGMGLGTSLMLKITVEQVLKEKGVKASVEACDIGSMNGVPADVIFTNPEFAKQIRHPTAKVVSIFNIASKVEVAAALDQLLSNDKG